MRCPRCNTEWPDELAGKLRFCGACGAPMNGQTTARQSATEAPGGEVRYVNVVFADLAGFTAFAEDRPPDEVAHIVGDLLQSLGQVVEEHGGIVDKFLGDAVVAIFGWPNPDPSAARNAVRAGQAMMVKAQQFNQERGFNFALRVGVHAGEAMFRVMGGSWTVMGDTVNTASRIQSAASPGKVWISRTVYEEVRRFFVLLIQPPVELKGKKLAIQPYEVFEERNNPLVNMPRFVGREKEWSQIHAILQNTIKTNSLQVLLIRGSAGVGKSRLVWELRDWISRQSVIYRLDLVQFDHSARLPSHGVNSLIRNQFNLPLHLSDEDLIKRLQSGVQGEFTSVDPGRETLAVEFFAFLTGVLQKDFHIYDMDGKNKWEGAFAELKAWFERHAQSEPWIWMLEDAQKGDMDTANFIEWALHTDWRSPVLIVISVREEDFKPSSYWYTPLTRWVKEGLVQEIQLREIPPDVLASGLATMLEVPIPAALALRIAEHTEGNPLFATELVLYLHEHGWLDSQTDWQHMTMPGSIREVMEARIEGFGIEGKEVAKRGALMGRRFTRDAIERIWENTVQDMNEGFDRLRKTEAIYDETSRFFNDEMESVFRHSRLHEAVLARIPREERIRWLRGLENWARSRLLTMKDDWDPSGILLIPLIARSLDENGDLWQASLWYEVLGQLHSKYNRLQDAIEAYKKALQCILNIKEKGIRRVVLACQIAELQNYLGDGETALQTLTQAASETDHATLLPADIPSEILVRLETLTANPLARWFALQPAEVDCILHLWTANVLTQLARVPEAVQAYHETEDRLLNLPDSLTSQRIWLQWAKAWAYLLSEINGDHESARKVFLDIRRRVTLSGLESDADRLVILSGETNVALNLGRYQEAREISNEWLAVAKSFKNHREEAVVWNARGICSHSLGDLAEASSCYEQALKLGRSIGHRRIEVIGLYNLSLIYFDELNLDKAEQCLSEYLSISRLTGNHLAECYGPYVQGNIALQRGEYDKANSLIDSTLQIAQVKGWPRLVGIGRQFQDLVKFHRGVSLNSADDILSAVEALAEQEQASEGYDGETYACWAIGLTWLDRKPEAIQIIQAGRKKIADGNPQDEQWLNLAESYYLGDSLPPATDWFEQHGFIRVVQFAAQLGRRQ